MKKAKVRRIVSAAGGLVCVGFCATCSEGKTTVPPLDAEQEYYCDAICRAYENCRGWEMSDCAEDCVYRAQAWFATVNPEALRPTSDCIRGGGCDWADVSELEEHCLELTGAALEPTAAAISACEALSPFWFDCGYQADVEQCVQLYTLWRAELLNEAEACADGDPACEEVEECVAAAFRK